MPQGFRFGSWFKLRWIRLFFLYPLQALKSVVLYVILAPYDNEQSDMLERVKKEKKIEEIPKYK